MTTTRISDGIRALVDKRPGRLILFICLIAGARVLVFTAGFPFFSNIDELAHFDLVCKYAQGHVPQSLEPNCDESATMMTLYNSPEFLSRPDDPAMHPPLWTLAPESVSEYIDQSTAWWKTVPNPESTQPPVYYAVAAGWYNLGKAMGIPQGYILYWLRMLNMLVYMLTVWVAYLLTRKLYGANKFIVFGVPLLLAFFPQDVFYSVNNDVFSALLCGLALYCMFAIHLSGAKGGLIYLAAGLAVAAAFLTKLTNLPLVLVCGVFMLYGILDARRTGKLKAELLHSALMLAAFALPVGAWLAMNYHYQGDLTGSLAKVELLGWSHKPFGEIWDHPIFSLTGIGVYWHELLKAFWRGELVWHGTPLAVLGMDRFYAISSILCLASAGIGLWAGRKKISAQEKLAASTNFLMVGLSVAMLIVLSTIYDFGDCFYPSHEYPYITSGRLITGMLIPFAILYVKGLDVILAKVKLSRLRWAVLLTIIIAMTASEALISGNVFASAYNWYHMF